MRELFEKVYGDYKISSLPYSSKNKAYEELEKFWKGAEKRATVWQDPKTKEWYIVSK